MKRLGLVIHPRRDISRALAALREWCEAHGVEIVQVPAAGQTRRIAPPGDPATTELIVALGGDGTTLAALRTGATFGKPVLGIACGSLGALTAVGADELPAALDRIAAGDWVAAQAARAASRGGRGTAEPRRQRPGRRPPGRRPGVGRGPARRRAVHPLRGRRARGRDAAGLERVHARGRRPAARAGRPRARLHAARCARRLLPAARRRSRQPVRHRARSRVRRRQDRGRRPDPRPRRAALAAAR